MASQGESSRAPPTPTLQLPPVSQPSRSGSSGSAHLAPSPSISGNRSTTNHASISTSSGTHSYVPIQRRLLSLHGTDDRVILDVGPLVTKIGFSGESRPRAIVPSIVAPGKSALSPARRGGKGKERSREGMVGDQEETGGEEEHEDALWSYDVARHRDAGERETAMRLLQARVEELVRSIYVQHLKIDPRQRAVLLLSSSSTPLPLHQALQQALFTSFRVPSIALVPSSLMALLATGRITGLVVDVPGGIDGCNHARGGETSVTPVVYGRMIETARTSTCRAGNAFRRRFKALLMRYGRYCYRVQSAEQQATSEFVSAAVAMERKVEKVPQDLLTPPVLDELMVRICAVARYLSPPESDSDAQRAGETEKEREERLQEHYRTAGGREGSAKAMSVPIASLQTAAAWIEEREAELNAPPPPNGSGSGSSRANLTSKDQEYRQSALLVVPGWVRERAAEVLFEDGDAEEPSLPEVVLDCLLKLPIDLRSLLRSRILVTGGLASMPSLPHRLSQQLKFRLEALAAQYDPSQPLSPTSLRTASKYVPLRGCAHDIGILNDHAPGYNPPLCPDVDTRTLPPPTAGTAPSFAPHLLPWIGASVVGALQTTSIFHTKREQWDAEQELNSLHAAPPATPVLGDTKSPVRGGRGSFVGVVGGLETGSYGALSAISRHLLSPTSETGPRSPPLRSAPRH